MKIGGGFVLEQVKLYFVNPKEIRKFRKMSLTNDDMDDDDADLLAAVESAENPPPAAVSEAPTTKGFVTATGKTVSVTESSLAMARRLWSSMSEDEMAAPEAHLKKMTELKRVRNDLHKRNLRIYLTCLLICLILLTELCCRLRWQRAQWQRHHKCGKKLPRRRCR